MRDCSRDNSIPNMMCNEIRYSGITYTKRIHSYVARARAMKIFAISPDTLSRIEIDFAVALIASRSIEYSPLFRTRIYRTDRQDAREEAEHEKSPIVNHRVTLCVYSCTSRLTGISLFSFLARVLLAERKEKKYR